MRHCYKLLTLFITIGCSTQNISEDDKLNVTNELVKMREIDQIYAGVPSVELKEKHGFTRAWEIYKIKGDSVNLVNQNKAKEILKTYGFIGINNFSKTASSNFWLIVQHADNDVQFQDKYLKLMKKELKKGNANKTNYAYLEDRVNVNKGKKQQFGTQVTYNNLGQAIPVNGLIDSLNIERIRTEYGLESFVDYYNDMTQMHFDMNKDSFIKKGIQAPILYK